MIQTNAQGFNCATFALQARSGINQLEFCTQPSVPRKGGFAHSLTSCPPCIGLNSQMCQGQPWSKHSPTSLMPPNEYLRTPLCAGHGT
eukprot:905075-Amphidinium_carterae.1